MTNTLTYVDLQGMNAKKVENDNRPQVVTAPKTQPTKSKNTKPKPKKKKRKQFTIIFAFFFIIIFSIKPALLIHLFFILPNLVHPSSQASRPSVVVGLQNAWCLVSSFHFHIHNKINSNPSKKTNNNQQVFCFALIRCWYFFYILFFKSFLKIYLTELTIRIGMT